VLAEHTAPSLGGNFITLSQVVLEKLPPQDDVKSFLYEQEQPGAPSYAFHYMVRQGVVCMCMAAAKFPRRFCLGFLDEIMTQFFNQYPLPHIQSAHAFAMNADFAPVLQGKMVFFNTDPSVDKLASVRKQIDDTKNMMLENIDKVLARGDRIDLLVEQTEGLEAQSFHFKKQSKKLYWAMIVKNIKLIILITIILIVRLPPLQACGG